jgi:hypothetical protein
MSCDHRGIKFDKLVFGNRRESKCTEVDSQGVARTRSVGNGNASFSLLAKVVMEMAEVSVAFVWGSNRGSSSNSSVGSHFYTLESRHR